MIDARQFLNLVVAPTLEIVDADSRAARALMLGTALVESNLSYLRQLGGGPALGFFQCEPATYQDVYDNYLAFDANRRNLVNSLAVRYHPGDPGEMAWNMRYACGVARMVYYRRPEPLPSTPEGLAAYHKQWYNTPAGATDPAESVVFFRQAAGVVDEQGGQ